MSAPHDPRFAPTNAPFQRDEQSVRFPTGSPVPVLRFHRVEAGQTVERFVPAVIGDRYHVDGVLSDAGGQGTIYVARDTTLMNRRCLVKANKYTTAALQRAAAGSTQEVERQRESLVRECRFAVTMQRRGEGRVPNVLHLTHDLLPALLQHTRRAPRDLLAREPYVVMQYIPGLTLKDVIAEVTAGSLHGGLRSRRWWRAALVFVRELASILAVIHEAEEGDAGGRRCQVAHFYGDLKPDNCLVTGGEFLTLIDLGGVRRCWRPLDAGHDEGWASETDPVFTLGYVAPEMVDPGYAGELDPRVDLYSVGALLFHMLTGQSPARLAGASRAAPVLSASDPTLAGELPDYVRALLSRALERDRERRFESASELKKATIDALQRLKRGE
ncbi:MAG: hypothetical protein Q8S73_20425 [Deltaproteobacteria bacterium]|nr:hypothetical protein [Myxococcales bacterium]MDP3216486.1 hypothetical protein [Deltaproteobacteria bacterium]